jgi:hypothetical protein
MSTPRKTYKITKKMKYFHLKFKQSSHLNRRRVPAQPLYTQILFEIFTKIFKEIILNGYEFKFYNLGVFKCVKYIPQIKYKDGEIVTNKPINIPETIRIRKETGKKNIVIYYDNAESNGFTYRFLWDTSMASFINRLSYKFKLYRPHKASLHKAIKDDTATASLITLNV